MSEINSSNFKKEHGDLAPDLVGVTELTSPYFFVPPSGTTAERPEDCEPGTLRFNTDIGNLEVFRGKTLGWESIQRRDGQYLGGDSANSVITTSTNSNRGTGIRGFKIGGYYPAYTDIIDYVTISTFGNASDFGNLNTATHLLAGTSSNTRAITGGGSPSTDEIQFFTMSSLGNASDFGNLSATRYGLGAVSNSTRGIFCTGYMPSANKDVIDYVTIASTGNAVDFGNSATPAYGLSTVNSTTRGIMAGGTNPNPGGSAVNAMSFITMSTLGDSVDFGDTLRTQYYTHSCICSATRGIFGGGYTSAPSTTNGIHFITMATLGNSIDFGDLIAANFSASGTSSSTRGLFMSGRTPGVTNTIEFIEIATTGNAVDFGDNTGTHAYSTATSNGHGGLQ